MGEGETGHIRGLNVCAGGDGVGRCGGGRKIFRPYGDLGGMGEGMSFVPMTKAYRRGQDMLHRLNPCPKVTSVPPW